MVAFPMATCATCASSSERLTGGDALCSSLAAHACLGSLAGVTDAELQKGRLFWETQKMEEERT